MEAIFLFLQREKNCNTISFGKPHRKHKTNWATFTKQLKHKFTLPSLFMLVIKFVQYKLNIQKNNIILTRNIYRYHAKSIFIKMFSKAINTEIL